MKYIKKIMFLIIINICGILNVNAATNPYPETGPYGPNCTWYAWKTAKEKIDITLPNWGNAKDWYNNAQKSGYEVGTTPKANSIVVWGDWTSYGHVGYIERVEENIIHVWDSTGPCIDEEDPVYQECMANGVSEESDKICKSNAKSKACEYTLSPDLYGITGYIYLNKAPKTPVQTTIKSTTKKKTTKTTKAKSNNANLSSLDLNTGNINFDQEILEYNITVENEVSKITIDAKTEDKKATIKGPGDYELNVGVNKIKIVVTAEDGSKKEYIIKVNRNEKTEIEKTETNSNQIKETPKKSNQQKMVFVTIFGLIISFIICLIYIFNKKKNSKKQINRKKR